MSASGCNSMESADGELIGVIERAVRARYTPHDKTLTVENRADGVGVGPV